MGLFLNRLRAAAYCRLCLRGVPHHTNARRSIGGTDRIVIADLHEVQDASGVGLAECAAAHVWDPKRFGRRRHRSSDPPGWWFLASAMAVGACAGTILGHVSYYMIVLAHLP